MTFPERAQQPAQHPRVDRKLSGLSDPPSLSNAMPVLRALILVW